MFWETLALIVVVGFVLAGGISTVKGRADHLLVQAIAALAVGGFNVYALGTVWFPIKIVAIWAVVLVLLRLVARRDPVFFSPGMGTWWFLSFWVVIAGLVGLVIEPPIVPDLAGGLRSRMMRPAVQTYTYLSLLALTPLALMGLRTAATVRHFWNRYALLALGSCAVAFVQWGMQSAGLRFMPILRMHGVHSEEARFVHAGEVVHRLYAFAGEPKALALFLLPICLAAMIAMLQPRPMRPWWGNPAVPLVLALVTILTYSTAALIALAIGALVVILWLPKPGTPRERLLNVASLGAICVVPTALLGAMSDLKWRVFDLIRLRTVDRLEADLLDRHEVEILRILFVDNPELALTGLGLGMFIFYIPGLLWGEGTDVIQSGWVTSLADLGLIGTALLVAFCGTALIRGAWTVRRLPGPDRFFPAVGMAALVGAAAIHVGWGVFALLTLFVGVIYATLATYPVPHFVRPSKRRYRAAGGFRWARRARSVPVPGSPHGSR